MHTLPEPCTRTRAVVRATRAVYTLPAPYTCHQSHGARHQRRVHATRVMRTLPEPVHTPPEACTRHHSHTRAAWALTHAAEPRCRPTGRQRRDACRHGAVSIRHTAERAPTCRVRAPNAHPRPHAAPTQPPDTGAWPAPPRVPPCGRRACAAVRRRAPGPRCGGALVQPGWAPVAKKSLSGGRRDAPHRPPPRPGSNRRCGGSQAQQSGFNFSHPPFRKAKSHPLATLTGLD